jgi:hypothetical protein
MKAYRTLRPYPRGQGRLHRPRGQSPVLVGAGENTRTLAAKGRQIYR